MAGVAHAAAADRAQVDAARGERLGEGRHRAGLVLQLDDELVGHGTLRGDLDRPDSTAARPLVASVPADDASARSPTRGAVSPASGRSTAAGIPFSALSWGDPDGRPLLLVHGVTASAAIWWRVGPALAATGRRVVAVDLPGHGRTGHWTGRHRFRDNAADRGGVRSGRPG